MSQFLQSESRSMVKDTALEGKFVFLVMLNFEFGVNISTLGV